MRIGPTGAGLCGCCEGWILVYTNGVLMEDRWDTSPDGHHMASILMIPIWMEPGPSGHQPNEGQTMWTPTCVDNNPMDIRPDGPRSI